MSPSPLATQCEDCSSKFSWLRKRRTCPMCRSVCCSSCMQRLKLCGVGRHCLRCARLAGVPYERAVLQQMTVRDLKHIMKMVDASPATCREKSDLVDTILTCRGQPAIQDTRTAPPVTTPPSASTAAGSSFARPSRSRPGDSSRVGPYESIRVRAVDTDEDFEPSAPSCPPSPTASADRLPTRDSDPAAAAADTDTDNVRPAVDVRIARDADVEGIVDAGQPDVEPAGTPPVAEEAARGAREAEADGEDVEAMDDDPDEPQSEAVEVEVEEEASVADDSVAEDGKTDLTDIRDVSQLASEDLISQLTVRQCKRLLQYHRINYRNVIEKEELLQSVRQIWREMRQNAEALASAPERDICKVCMDALVDCVMLECGHMATCTECGKRLAECPICRRYVVRVVHVFRA